METLKSQNQENVLEQVMTLFYQGKRIDAQQMLARYLLDHAQDAEGWFTMSKLVEDDDRRKQCLERALMLRPDYDEAQWALAKFNPSQLSDEDPNHAMQAALRNTGLVFQDNSPVLEDSGIAYDLTQANGAKQVAVSTPQRPKVEALVFPPVKTGVVILLVVGMLLSLAMAAGGAFWLNLQVAGNFTLESISTAIAPLMLLVLGVLITILLLIVLLRRTAEARVFNRLSRTGRVASGLISDRWTEWDIEDVNDIYMVSYRFELQRRENENSAFEAKQQVSKKLFDRLSPGSEVNILYLAEDPVVSRLDLHYKY